MKVLPLAKVFQLLEPGPVVLLTTAHKGQANVMTMSWLTMMEFVPPLIGCVISPGDYSYAAVRATRECVIAVPTVEMAKTVVKTGNCSGQDIDKFKEFNLTPLPAEQVKAPLLSECLANLECRVVNTSLVKKYALFILEVVKAWIDPKHKECRMLHHYGDGTFSVDGETLNLKKLMVKWQDMP